MLSAIDVCIRALCLSFISTVVWAGTLSVRIYDENGAPVSGRVYLRDGHDHPLLAPHTVKYTRANKFGSEFHFVAPHGTFSVHLPSGNYHITIERGKEYLPIDGLISLQSTGTVTKKFRLQRWTNMMEKGWYSADMHVHASLQDLPTLMEAEDLNLALPMTVWRLPGGLVQRDPDVQNCLSRSAPDGAVQISDSRWFLCINEELESWSSSLLVSHLGRQLLPLRYPYVAFAEAAHERGAFTDSEKATALELPADAALGGVDFVGVANNHLWPSGCDLVHWGAWPSLLLQKYPFTCTGFVLANLDIYYALLQTGLRLRLSAGSAYGVHPVPLGWSRIYAHVSGKFTPEGWFKALTDGHSFVTTGPMLLLKANGLEPGDQSINSKFPLNVNVQLQMLSLEPLRSAQIVVNGLATPIELKPDPAVPNTYIGNTEITLWSSSWIAGRYICPKGRSISMAHSSPIYFWHDSKPLVPSMTQIRYLRDRVRNLINQVAAETDTSGSATDAKIVLDAPARRQQTLTNFEKALAFYELAWTRTDGSTLADKPPKVQQK